MPTDEMLAREIAKLHGEAFIISLCKFVAAVRLDEAKWWHDALKEDEAEISIYLVETFSKRLAALEQAAGGSAAK